MGCHTWFYKRVERSPEEAREKWLANNASLIESYERMSPETALRMRLDLASLQKFLTVLRRQAGMVKAGLCGCAVMGNQPDDDLGRYVFHNGLLYVTDDALPHDVFRIGEYPEDRLMSYDECMAFIENNRERVYSFGGARGQDTTR